MRFTARVLGPCLMVLRMSNPLLFSRCRRHFFGPARTFTAPFIRPAVFYFAEFLIAVLEINGFSVGAGGVVLLRIKMHKVGPNEPVIIWPELLPRYDTICDALNGHACSYGNGPTPVNPLIDKARCDTDQFCERNLGVRTGVVF